MENQNEELASLMQEALSEAGETKSVMGSVALVVDALRQEVAKLTEVVNGPKDEIDVEAVKQSVATLKASLDEVQAQGQQIIKGTAAEDEEPFPASTHD